MCWLESSQLSLAFELSLDSSVEEAGEVQDHAQLVSVRFPRFT